MLPKRVLSKIIYAMPKRTGSDYKNEIQELKSCGYDDVTIQKMLISQEDRRNALDEIGVKKNNPFYEYYLNYVDETKKDYIDPIYSLDEIYENYQTPFPLYSKYPQIGKRYLQISSPEGEHSYFYDKETGAVYSVDWSRLEDLNEGKLKPMFNSFYDFLERYYSEDDD